MKRLLFLVFVAAAAMNIYAPAALAQGDEHSQEEVSCHGEGEDFHCHGLPEGASCTPGENGEIECQGLPEGVSCHGTTENFHCHGLEAEGHAHSDEAHSEDEESRGAAQYETSAPTEIPDTGGPSILIPAAALLVGGGIIGVFAINRR